MNKKRYFQTSKSNKYLATATTIKVEDIREPSAGKGWTKSCEQIRRVKHVLRDPNTTLIKNKFRKEF